MGYDKYGEFKYFAGKDLHYFLSIILFIFFFIIFEDEKNSNFILSVGYYKMFAMSIAIFSLLAYINDYINSKAKDFADKSEYYYGVNVSEISFYNRIEFKLFFNARLELFLTILVIIPALFILSKFTYHSLVFIHLFKLLDFFKRVIFSVWCSIFLLIFIYLIIILNGIFAESRKSFYDSYRIDIDKIDTKIKEARVLRNISFQTKKSLEKLVEESKLNKGYMFIDKSSHLTYEILKKGNILSTDKSEFNLYLSHTYFFEKYIMDDLFSYEAGMGTGINMVKDYYLGKWIVFGKLYFSKMSPYTFINCATKDIKDISNNILLHKDNDLYNLNLLRGGVINLDPFGDDYCGVENAVLACIIDKLGLRMLDINFVNPIRANGEIIRFIQLLCNLKNDKVIDNFDFRIYLKYLLNCLRIMIIDNNKSKLYIFDEIKEYFTKKEHCDVLLEVIEEIQENIDVKK